MEKHLKENSLSSFFIQKSNETEKGVNYRSKDALSDLLMSVKGSKVTRQFFIFRESEKGLNETPGGFLFCVFVSVRVRKRDKSLPGCILMYLRARERTKTKLGMPPA